MQRGGSGIDGSDRDGFGQRVVWIFALCPNRIHWGQVESHDLDREVGNRSPFLRDYPQEMYVEVLRKLMMMRWVRKIGRIFIVPVVRM